MPLTVENKTWNERAQQAFESLLTNYWNPELGMFNNHYPNPDNKCNLTFHYWWYAHAIDSLVDAYERTKDERIPAIIQQKYNGLVFRNGGQPTNMLYDDMEWLAIALLRAYRITNNEQYLRDVHVLWEDIKTGWNDHMGGGIAWHKEMPHYKNTPANAPAVILAARLYQSFGNEEDLKWARKIFDWLEENLVEADTGFVIDGVNRLEDGKIDEWEFTYCQGVYIGAGVELYRITKDSHYLDKALLTANTAMERLTDAKSNVLQQEGIGDGGLFKGIMIRYMTELVVTAPDQTHSLRKKLEENAESLWSTGKDEATGLFNDLWSAVPDMTKGVSLSVQLSGVMLMESMAALEGTVVT